MIDIVLHLRDFFLLVFQTLVSYQLADAIEQPIRGADIESLKEDYIRDQEATLEMVDDLVSVSEIMIIIIIKVREFCLKLSSREREREI